MLKKEDEEGKTKIVVSIDGEVLRAAIQLRARQELRTGKPISLSKVVRQAVVKMAKEGATEAI